MTTADQIRQLIQADAVQDGRVVAVSGSVATVSTGTGSVRVDIPTGWIVGAGDRVRVASGAIIGRLGRGLVAEYVV